MVGKTWNHPHHAHASLLNEGIDTKTPNAGGRDGEVAFLGALELGRRLSLMMERASVSVWLGDSGWGDTLAMAPSTLMAGKSAVMNKSPAIAADQQLEQVVDEFTGLIAFHLKSSCMRRLCADASFLVLAQTGTDHAQAQRQLRASKATRLAASWDPLSIMSSMASALSSGISQSVSVVHAEKRMPLSQQRHFAQDIAGPRFGQAQLLAQGCTRSTAMVPGQQHDHEVAIFVLADHIAVGGPGRTQRNAPCA